MPVIQLWEAEVGISFELRILSHRAIESLCQTKNILAMDQSTWSTWNSTKGHQAYKDIRSIVGGISQNQFKMIHRRTFKQSRLLDI